MEYDYRGYTITETPEGYFEINGYEFESYDDACDYVDDLLDAHRPNQNVVPELHLYHIFYVPKSLNCGYDEYIHAYSPDEARAKLKAMHKDIAYIADMYELD